MDGGNTVEDTANAYPLIGEIVNDMIPYSLQFYLGMADEEEDDVIEIDDDEDE